MLCEFKEVLLYNCLFRKQSLSLFSAGCLRGWSMEPLCLGCPQELCLPMDSQHPSMSLPCKKSANFLLFFQGMQTPKVVMNPMLECPGQLDLLDSHSYCLMSLDGTMRRKSHQWIRHLLRHHSIDFLSLESFSCDESSFFLLLTYLLLKYNIPMKNN